MSIFVRRCKNLCRTAAIFSASCLRYPLSYLDSQGTDRASQHAPSQLMILSPKLRRLYGMITPSERAYLYWYGKHIFSGKGDIVDLGCWLGRTTISLAMGLEHNNHARFNKLIHSYDEFVWRPYMDNGAKGTDLEGKYQAGDSFMDEFERRTYRWRHCIKACPGDLAKVGWHGGTIEFLLIDAMKSWDAASGVVRMFFPALMPRVSIIFHQDFAHWYTAWIHPIQYRLREYFEPLYDVPASGSMVFRLIRPLSPEVLNQEWSPRQFSNEDIDAAFAYSLDIVAAKNGRMSSRPKSCTSSTQASSTGHSRKLPMRDLVGIASIRSCRSWNDESPKKWRGSGNYYTKSRVDDRISKMFSWHDRSQ